MNSSTRFHSEDADPAALGTPLHFEFAGKTASNRFLKGAMTERMSSWDPVNLEARGIPSDALINVYRRWGESGFGVLVTGNIMFEYDHLEAAGNPIVPRGAPFEGDRFERFKELATQSKKHGSLLVGQVAHPGRQVQDVIQKHPVAPSEIQLEGVVLGMTFAKPRAATHEDIASFIDGFAHVAAYTEAAGYDGIQLHAAHGYLLAQFLSQTTNHRTDKYGGSLENRARIIVEIAREIRQRTKPNFIIGIKINSVEFQNQGFTTDEAAQLCQLLEENRFDFVELSGGTYESLAFDHKKESTRKREAFFLEFAELITPRLSKTGTKSYITGGLKTTGAMVRALEVVDGVGLARTVCQEPDFPKDVLSGKVKGALVQLLDENNFSAVNIVAAGTQIRQLGNGHDPIDLSKPSNVDTFMSHLGTWVQAMSQNTDGMLYGYPDLIIAEST